MDTKQYRTRIEQSVARVQARALKSARRSATADPSRVVGDKKTAPEIRAAALGRLTRDEGPNVVPEAALQSLADPQESPVVRLAAIKLLQQQQIFSPVAAEWRPAFVDALRAAVRDPKVRAAALEVLSLLKDPEPLASFAEPLRSAVINIQHRDEIVRLTRGGGDASGAVKTTAMSEVMQTIGWLGRAGMACVPSLEELLARNPGPATSAMIARAIEAIRSDDRMMTSAECHCEESTRPHCSKAVTDIADLRFQDHHGAELTFAQAFHGHPSIVVFFYTRCDNPTKCPLTMYKFGSLQRLLQHSGLGDAIGMAAITYDPEYDRADRLLQYAQSWGVKPSPEARILRTVGDFPALSDYFSLGVNFSASGIVNRHQVEAFVLDQRGHIAHVIARRRWDEAELVRLAARLC